MDTSSRLQRLEITQSGEDSRARVVQTRRGDVTMNQRPVSSADHDARRLAAVEAVGVVRSEPEEAFDRLARLAATVLGAPLAFVTLVDSERSWYKSSTGGASKG